MESMCEKLRTNGVLTCMYCTEIFTPPIILVPEFGNVCENCFATIKVTRTVIGYPNDSLAVMLNELNIRCKFANEGCPASFNYKELKQHEIGCKFKLLQCPWPNCPWKGAKLAEHCTDGHEADCIRTDTNQVALNVSASQTNEIELFKLIVIKYHRYVLRLRLDVGKKVSFIVCKVKDDGSTSTDYTVKFVADNEDYLLVHAKLLNSLSSINSETDAINLNDLNATKIIFEIGAPINSNEINEKLMHHFECPVCKNFMRPPIFLCQSGHSICNMCRPRVEKCPTCRSPFGHTRNFSLEGLTTGLHYPCIYQDLGCMENCTVALLQTHESSCAFKPLHCPFGNCTLSGNLQLIKQHLREFHADNLLVDCLELRDSFRLELNNFYVFVQPPNTNRRCMIYDDNVFVVSLKKTQEEYFWAVQMVGMAEEGRFLYEVSIVDSRRTEKKISKTDYCLTHGQSEDDLFKRCIGFQNNVLASYAVNGMVSFHLRLIISG